MSCVTALTGLGLLLPSLATAGDFKRFPEYAYEAREQSDVEALKELLRQAKELQKAEDAEAEASAKQEADDQAKADKKAAADAAVVKQGGSARAGCMYRDEKLIWEKTPGACKP